MADDPLATPVQFVKGVGPVRAELLARLNLRDVADLLFNLPRDYLDLTHVVSPDDLREGELQTVRGRVVDREAKRLRDGRTVSAVLLDCGRDFVRGVWFNQSWVYQRFVEGSLVLFSGKPKRNARRWEFHHPRVQWLDEDDTEATGGVLPRYGLTEGLRMHEMRRLMRTAVEEFSELVPDPLPEAFRVGLKLPRVNEALRMVHLPSSLDQAERGRQRLVFDDLLEFQLGLALRRRLFRKQSAAPRLPTTAKIDSRIRRLLPFELTAGQNRAIAEICSDLDSGLAMHRLLQADVGAGKTVVALYAMLVAIAADWQAVLMAPTELLASQHWQTVERMLAASRVQRQLLTGQLTAAERQRALDGIRSGDVQLIVGTQAIIQKAVTFGKLGLVVIDEQHKFGVTQRAHFSASGSSPHTLVMTATPIPRSLCLTQFGDLDLSVIDELPPGRQKITTSKVTSGPLRAKAWNFVRDKLRSGRQAYIVCPRVGDEGRESDDEGVTVSSLARASGTGGPAASGIPRSEVPASPGGAPFDSTTPGAEQVFQELQAGELRGFRLGLVHGRVDRDERTATMEAFRRGEIQALVATTVVEVGVDVPNATLMIVLGAERYGLSQLHQLRGRIGRGQFPGYCFLFSETETAEATARLAAMESTSSGFEIAEADFQLRGPGDVLGLAQHGDLPLRVADLVRDQAALADARAAAFDLVASNTVDAPEFAALKRTVIDRFGKLFDIVGSG
jgi:ATP-dependent DNA helicase RecG